jgi:hypothetical protein
MDMPDQESGRSDPARDPADIDLPKLILEVRAVILKFVPETGPIIQEQLQYWEEDAGIPVTLYEHVGYLAGVLVSSIEERNNELTRRGLQAVEELLGIPSPYLEETIDFQMVEPFPDLLLEVRELCGPRLLSILEDTNSYE